MLYFVLNENVIRYEYLSESTGDKCKININKSYK
jgi:hypothetical protein